jgi:DNA repair photolyase
VPFDVSINPYRGCEHGCAYCFARPTHAYLNLSPGLDFETKIFTKPEAAALLAKEIGKRGYVCTPRSGRTPIRTSRSSERSV